MLHQPIQHAGHLPAGLAGADHVDIEVAKQVSMRLQGPAQGCTALDGLQDALQQFAHRRLVAHLNEHAQGVVQRQPGTQHDGQL